MPRGPSLETKRRWFSRGAAAWRVAERILGVSDADDAPGRYVCPLCLTIDHEKRSARFKAFDESAIAAKALTVEHVPPESLGGRPLLLTCDDCNHWSGTHLDAHARRRENPRDAFLGKVKTKVSMHFGHHRLAGAFILADNQLRLEVTEKKAYRPDALPGAQQYLVTSADSDKDITLSFDKDQFDDDRARASWLRAAYLAWFSVTGYRTLLGREMEVVRRQIREPKAGHISTFLIDTRKPDDWTDRALLRFTQPEWLRCWGIKVGRYVVCVPLPGDAGFYDRLAAARRNGVTSLGGNANSWEWPKEPSFGVPIAEPKKSA